MNIIEKLSFLPYCFFIFISSFLLIEFIFIFFLNASFSPQILFDLTPFHLIEGTSNLQLLVLSLFLCLINSYLHIKENTQFILYSMIPTSLMIAGVSTQLVMNGGSIEYIPHYLTFGLLLLVIPIDHNNYLKLRKSPITKPDLLPSRISSKPEKKYTLPDINIKQKLSKKLPKIQMDSLFQSNKQPNFIPPPESDNNFADIYEKLDNLTLPKKMKTHNTNNLYKYSSRIEKSFDLLKLKDMKPKYADLLVDCGINTIHNLAFSNADDLLKDIEMHLILSDEEMHISYAMVSHWIIQAKEAIKK